MCSEFENKSDGYMRAFMDNRLQTIRAAEEAAEATPEEVPARLARGRHASEQARLRFLMKIHRLRHSVLLARPRLALPDGSDTEFRPQKLFEFDADAHDDASGSDSHPQASPTYKSGCWVLKHVGDTVDSELPGEIAIEHMVDHSV